MAINTAKLRVCIPFAADGDLGGAYNDIMWSLPDDGWACLLDHDVMFTTGQWHQQLLSAIERWPSGTFTARTNRIGPDGKRKGWQRAEVDPNNHDIAYHRKIGTNLAKLTQLRNVTEEHKLCAGLLILISRKTWFAMGKFEHGLRGIDYAMHLNLRRIQRPLFVIEGLYLYHWRRANKESAKGTIIHDWRSNLTGTEFMRYQQALKAMARAGPPSLSPQEMALYLAAIS